MKKTFLILNGSRVEFAA